jgi:hypothetical protein
LFGAAIFLSAFLLFEVEPLIARLILPWFGGSAAVWTACMLFFQAVLLAGYAYAHWLQGRRAATQRATHLLLLGLSLLWLPVLPSAAWKLQGAEDPLPRIFGLLAAATFGDGTGDSIYQGERLSGRVRDVLLRGRAVVRRGGLVPEAAAGAFLRRAG